MEEFLESACNKHDSCISIFSVLLTSMESFSDDDGGGGDDNKNRAYCCVQLIYFM